MTATDTLDEHYGIVNRKPCPINACDGERVTHQSADMPLGTTTMACTGTCGASRELGVRIYGSEVQAKYPDASRQAVEAAVECPADDCTDRVPVESGYYAKDVPFDTPDDVTEITYHRCVECDTHFTVYRTEDGDTRLHDVTDDN